MHHSTHAPTQTESQRFAEFEWMGCVVARLYFGVYAAYDVHHLLDGGVRRGHMYTIPLAVWYHRGNPPDGYTVNEATVRFGPSMARDKTAFAARFGSDLELLEAVNAMIEHKRKIQTGGSRRRDVPAPIVASKWTIVMSKNVAVRTKSASIADKVAAQRTDAKSGTVDGVEGLDLNEYEARSA